MGRDVPAITVSQQDRRQYREKVRQCLDVLAQMLRDSWFETSTRQVGLEIELNLVDDSGRPSMRSTGRAGRDRGPVLGHRARPVQPRDQRARRGRWRGRPGPLEAQLLASLKHADQRARDVGSTPAHGRHPAHASSEPTWARTPVGEPALLGCSTSRSSRRAARTCGSPSTAPDRLPTHADNITPEAACTSIQFHLQVSPEAFAHYWNAAQAIAGVQVALAANSPFLFGRELWHETRITLFEQATDTRPEELKVQGVRPRVWFGERWITSVFDLFEENLRYFPALLPLVRRRGPARRRWTAGGVPELGELTLHNGTVYRWNRPVYAVTDGRPHLRVENRVLPAGPTVADIIANAAFYYGLVRALAEDERPIWTRMSFAAAEENLHGGGPARHRREPVLAGPGRGAGHRAHAAAAAAPGPRGPGPVGRGRRGTPTAASASSSSGASPAATARPGRRRPSPAGAPRRLDRREALRRMTQHYIEHMHTNEPVHTWPPGY